MTNLFISLYHEKDKARSDELHKCLMNNLKSGCFDAVWIIAEDDGHGLKYLRDVSPYTVNVLPCTVRPTFRTFFEVINNLEERFERAHYFQFFGVKGDVTVRGYSPLGAKQGFEGNVNIVANSDIYFESLPVLPKSNQVFALTRYEVKKNGPIIFVNRSDCQDSWLFRGKIQIPKFADFWPGLPGCDNRIAAELKAIGYDILNPSLTIKTFHLHEGDKSYDGSRKVNRPYHFIKPTE